MLSDRHVNDICLIYQGAKQCRYLEGDPDDHRKYYCRKKTSDRKIIDEMCKEYIDDVEKRGQDPMDGDLAICDNCSGFVPFKDLLQGYDVETT